ncbi:MAG: hypothetical protein J0I84_06605 [Terrimonas sp.]|nr:hypothetical protein [Terrimonas sp.]OJY97890.1 MAG: hypothetical protein BGP13_09475 [Sphingobacteriales bacterium 40-81]
MGKQKGTFAKEKRKFFKEARSCFAELKYALSVVTQFARAFAADMLRNMKGRTMQLLLINRLSVYYTRLLGYLDYQTVEALKNRIDKVIYGLGIAQHFEYWG